MSDAERQNGAMAGGACVLRREDPGPGSGQVWQSVFVVQIAVCLRVYMSAFRLPWSAWKGLWDQCFCPGALPV